MPRNEFQLLTVPLAWQNLVRVSCVCNANISSIDCVYVEFTAPVKSQRGSLAVGDCTAPASTT